MPRVNITSKDIEKVLVRYGFVFVGQKGSHQQFKAIINGVKRRVTVLDNKKGFDIKRLREWLANQGLMKSCFLKRNRFSF